MAKILDIITILFKGDTSDLKKKKEEAAKVADDINKKLKEQKSGVDAIGTSLDANVKRLENTVKVADSIDKAFVNIRTTLTDIAEASDPFPIAQKVEEKTQQTQKNIAATKKGADSLEGTLKSIVKQFASAALGALTVSKLIGEFKGVATGALSESQFSRSLGIDITKIDALGQALKEVGGDANDVQVALGGLSQKTSLYGPVLSQTFSALLKQYRDIKNESARLAFGSFLQGEFGFPTTLLNAEKLPNFQENVNTIEAANDAIDKTKNKVLELNTAWAGFTTEVRKGSLDILNALAPIGTFFLNLSTKVIENKGLITDIFRGLVFGNPDSQLRAASGIQQNIQNTSFTLPQTSRLAQAISGNISLNVDTIQVNAPNATDANGIAGAVTDSLLPHIRGLRDYYNNGQVA